MKINTYACDVWQAPKKSTNHWWLALVFEGQFVVRPWDDHAAADSDAIHLCGQACVQKKLNEFLAAEQHASAAPEAYPPVPPGPPAPPRAPAGFGGLAFEKTELKDHRPSAGLVNRREAESISKEQLVVLIVPENQY
jgi:hypothetical protein